MFLPIFIFFQVILFFFRGILSNSFLFFRLIVLHQLRCDEVYTPSFSHHLVPSSFITANFHPAVLQSALAFRNILQIVAIAESCVSSSSLSVLKCRYLQVFIALIAIWSPEVLNFFDLIWVISFHEEVQSLLPRNCPSSRSLLNMKLPSPQ